MTERIDLGLKDTTPGCACCATAPATDAPLVVPAAVTEQILVSGMTCSHCVSSITEELTSIDGVNNVTVELNAGGASRVTIHSAISLAAVQVRAAVEEAGYAMAESPV